MKKAERRRLTELAKEPTEHFASRTISTWGKSRQSAASGYGFSGKNRFSTLMLQGSEQQEQHRRSTRSSARGSTRRSVSLGRSPGATSRGSTSLTGIPSSPTTHNPIIRDGTSAGRSARAQKNRPAVPIRRSGSASAATDLAANKRGSKNGETKFL